MFALPLLLALAAGCPSGGGARQRALDTSGDEDIAFPDEVEAEAARHPASPKVAEGEAALAAGNLALAQQAFEEAVDENDSDPRAHLNLGLVRELQNQYPGAESSYRRAVELDPEFAEALNNLGLLLRDLERREEAIDVLRQATAAKRDFGEAWLNLAMTLEEAGQNDAAREAYEEATRLRPDDALARANLGLLWLRLGENDLAAIELRRALPLARGDAAALSAIGNGLRRAGHAEPAVDAMERAIASSEQPAPALYAELALARRANGDAQGAENALDEAIGVDPEYATAHGLLGSMLAARGAYAEAIAAFERALALEGDHALAPRWRQHLEAARAAQ